MTFADHLRRRRSYTEAGLALKEALAGMPDTVQTSHQVHAWLRETGASQLAQYIALEAARRYDPQTLRKQAKRAVGAIGASSC
ncbi:hypothetical protein ACFQS7_27315 [Dankookia sp. GCM10030260]|uniref:hypothetical protein n=1 Tax=Dankookia sp. GCM10030260 TaxID=3273390 RepID=UPI0036075385